MIGIGGSGMIGVATILQKRGFKVTGSGKLKRNKAGHSHMLIRRDKDVKRSAKKATMVAPSFEKSMKKMMAKAGS